MGTLLCQAIPSAENLFSRTELTLFAQAIRTLSGSSTGAIPSNCPRSREGLTVVARIRAITGWAKTR
jgi:hypothetical protein